MTLRPSAGRQLRRLPQRRGLRARGGPRLRGERACRQAARRSIATQRAPASCTSAPTTCSTAPADEPYDEERRCPNPRSIYAISKLAGEHAALAYAGQALVVRTGGPLRAARQRVEGRQLRHEDDRARQRAGQCSGVVADQRLTPTLTADLAAGIVAAVDDGVTGTLHVTNAGATTWHGFTEAIMELAASRRARRADEDGARTRSRGPAAERRAPLALPISPTLRPWRDALADYH